MPTLMPSVTVSRCLNCGISTRLALATLVVLAGLVGCGRGDATPSNERQRVTSADRPRIVVIAHGTPQDRFWSVVERGTLEAGRDLGVEVEFRAPDGFDLNAMIVLARQAIESQPQGLILTMPDVERLRTVVDNARRAGIPVVTMNSGAERAAELSILAHVGQDEREAGRRSAERLLRGTVTAALVVDHEPGNAGLEQRISGLRSVFESHQIPLTVVSTPLGGADFDQALASALDAEPEIDAVISLGSSVAPRLVSLLDEKGRLGGTTVATFDLSSQIASDLRLGRISFAVDQQPYQQGYLSVLHLVLYLRNGGQPADRLVSTGPVFITEAGAASALEKIATGRR